MEAMESEAMESRRPCIRAWQKYTCRAKQKEARCLISWQEKQLHSAQKCIRSWHMCIVSANEAICTRKARMLNQCIYYWRYARLHDEVRRAFDLPDNMLSPHHFMLAYLSKLASVASDLRLVAGR